MLYLWKSKQFSLFDIFHLGLGDAIGSGTFVMVGSGIVAISRSIFISVAFGCLFMLMAYFFHVVMSSMFVLEGGDYDMKAMLFNPTLTGVSAVFTMMGGIGFAMYGGAIADYASMVFPVIGEYTKLTGIGIITPFFAAITKGSSFVSKINNVMTVVLIASIALFVIMGLPKVQPGFFDPVSYTHLDVYKRQGWHRRKLYFLQLDRPFHDAVPDQISGPA